jgi:hypothetical protein
MPVSNKKNKDKKIMAASQESLKIGVESSFHDVLGGTFLTRKGVVKLLPFILYLTFLALLYIANTYYAEKKVREIADIRMEMKELRYEYITTKSELMFNTKQTEIAKHLANTGIEESTQPPHKIYLEK